ncbi:SAM-dependent methyltransferase [Sphingomonas sp. 1P06PA]|uniref:SAM-dependent methyltransferase n=1 Tax=Sphingomonas sp. 1P06PA TaxID=554121 RepID=UPI0039A5C7C5
MAATILSRVRPARSAASVIDDVLAALRRRGRRAIRIVDLDCRSGRRLIDIAARARAKGFLAIEARGCDRSPLAIAAARRAGAAHRDPAIGWQFDVADPASAIAAERDGADLILAAGRTAHSPAVAERLRAATGDTLIVTAPADRPPDSIPRDEDFDRALIPLGTGPHARALVVLHRIAGEPRHDG